MGLSRLAEVLLDQEAAGGTVAVQRGLVLRLQPCLKPAVAMLVVLLGELDERSPCRLRTPVISGGSVCHLPVRGGVADRPSHAIHSEFVRYVL